MNEEICDAEYRGTVQLVIDEDDEVPYNLFYNDRLGLHIGQRSTLTHRWWFFLIFWLAIRQLAESLPVINPPKRTFVGMAVSLETNLSEGG